MMDKLLMMKELIKSLGRRFLPRKSPADNRFQFLETGFHGDLYLLELLNQIMKKCSAFVETGSNVGSTLAYVATRFPAARCFSCEPDQTAFNHARDNTKSCTNVSLSNEMSQSFMKRVADSKERSLRGDVLFWLDAHDYGFEWPLREEIETITSHWEKGFVLIDDFLVPGLDCFGYDEYDGQVCSFDYIKDSLSNKHEYRLYYPSYTDKTSKTHPLRGWGLIEFGHSTELGLPENLVGKIRKAAVIAVP